MPKKLSKLGKSISEKQIKALKKSEKKISTKVKQEAEIQNVSHQGIWILVHEKEFFMPFAEFPWFLKATIQQIYDVELFHENHLHWPALDIDIDVESLKNPEQYPLKFS